jgi:FtsP/CotA-like multicopper oxidase with cupredoxin domain
VAQNRVVILAVVVVVFLAVGGFLIARNTGGGGRPVTINLTVTGSTMTPTDTPTAKQGDRVTMTITADKAEEVHLHGYDIPFEVPSAGGSVTHTFTADKSGSFEMELEATSTHLGQFQVSP